jgi:hypothetical protein
MIYSGFGRTGMRDRMSEPAFSCRRSVVARTP